jgi:ACT domain-containing protein
MLEISHILYYKYRSNILDIQKKMAEDRSSAIIVILLLNYYAVYQIGDVYTLY